MGTCTCAGAFMEGIFHVCRGMHVYGGMPCASACMAGVHVCRSMHDWHMHVRRMGICMCVGACEQPFGLVL